MCLSRTLRVVAVVSVLACASALAAPAEALVTTSTGVGCTVVGSAGPDALAGTPGRDVICGRGGDDVIRGMGGDDLIDASAGADRVYGGTGNDRLVGATGADRLDGGDGSDRISGAEGADVILGGGGADTINGGDDGDRIDGGPLNDEIAGQGGDDTVAGGSGADHLSGQAGDDEFAGGDGPDVVDGQIGDDFLEGDAGADDLDGGPGTNMCVVDSVDESTRCKYDEAPPVAVETRITPGTVDVTDAPAQVTIEVHATDDTGVEDVQVQLHNADYSIQLGGPPAMPTSENARDGWWETTFEVSRYSKPAELRPTVIVRDRLDRMTFEESSPARLRITNTNPDTQTPRMTLLAPWQGEVDVRERYADVEVSVRATDNLSGVARVDLCLTRLDRESSRHLYADVVCQEDVPKASGTIRDGVYTTLLRLPKGSPAGDYNVEAYATDFAQTDSGVRFMGPDAYPAYVASGSAGPEPRPFPDGAGRVGVIGNDNTTRPWVESVGMTPSQVDTLPDDATTHVQVHARDAAGEGVTAVSAVLVPSSDSIGAPQFDRVDLVLATGDLEDGIWEGDLTLPQSAPPGRYDVLVFVSDVSLSSSYTGTGSPYADDPGYTTLVADPHVVVVPHQ
jgi:Ca2+-binding RTX toxin-like protein